MQKTVKGKLAFDCPVVRLYFGFTPTFDIEPFYIIFILFSTAKGFEEA